MCIWQMKSKKIRNQTITNNILPDACIDIVIDFTNQILCFAGFSKETESFKLQKKIDYMGVRLKPGAFYLLFQIDATTIMDNQVPFSQVETIFHLEEILTYQTTKERIELLKKYLSQKIKQVPNKYYIEVINTLYENPKEQSVTELALECGYHQRQLFRMFQRYYGVSPKVLFNILRLHLCLTLLLEKNTDLLEIAMQCGFYDQSHFIKEIKRYTGISPLKLLHSYQI